MRAGEHFSTAKAEKKAKMLHQFPKLINPYDELFIRQRRDPGAAVSLREMAAYAVKYTRCQATIAELANQMLDPEKSAFLARAAPSVLDAVQEETALGRRLLMDFDDHWTALVSGAYGECGCLLIGALPSQVDGKQQLHYGAAHGRMPQYAALAEAFKLLLAAVPLTEQLEVAIQAVHDADDAEDDQAEEWAGDEKSFYRFLDTLSDAPRICEIKQTFLRALANRD